MNERIEKLVAEAFFDETADASDNKMYKLNDTQMQKFAELIVRECATLIPAEQSHAPNGQPILKIFQEHFEISNENLDHQ